MTNPAPLRLSARQAEVIAQIAAGTVFYTQATGAMNNYCFVAVPHPHGGRNTRTPVNARVMNSLWSKKLVQQVGVGIRMGGPATVQLKLTGTGREYCERVGIPIARPAPPEAPASAPADAGADAVPLDPATFRVLDVARSGYVATMATRAQAEEFIRAVPPEAPAPAPTAVEAPVGPALAASTGTGPARFSTSPAVPGWKRARAKVLREAAQFLRDLGENVAAVVCDQVAADLEAGVR